MVGVPGKGRGGDREIREIREIRETRESNFPCFSLLLKLPPYSFYFFSSHKARY
jgi:hypothetical protein